MTARIIEANDLFCVASMLRSKNLCAVSYARRELREISMAHSDLTVANVAAKLSRPAYKPTPGGEAA